MRQRLTILSITVFTLLSTGTSAWARDEQAATTSTMKEKDKVTATSLRKEEYAIRPEIGFMNYQDDRGQGTTTTTFGILLDMNALNAFDLAKMSGGDWYLGATSGLMYSRVGTFGSSFLSLPVNVKCGRLLTENIRIGIHGGGDVTYRSTAFAMQLESPGAVTTSSHVDLFPNAGADLDVAIGKQLVASFRPDVIFNSGKSLFSGAFSLTIPLATG